MRTTSFFAAIDVDYWYGCLFLWGGGGGGGGSSMVFSFLVIVGKAWGEVHQFGGEGV